MSASEKLKELDGALSDAPWRRGPGPKNVDELSTLRNALPQIVAVVEATEDYESTWSGYGVGLHDQPIQIEDALRRLRAALTALEEAL